MLRVDPKQRDRIVEILANLSDRIKEAELNGWLGEVAGLRTSRDAAAKKLTSLDRSTALAQRAGPTQTHLGLPTRIHTS
jgi:hypothetical protein